MIKNPNQKPVSRIPSKRVTGDVTLDVVAKVAGVSAITVSRAINKPEKVAPKTLEKINRAIAETGYVPNLLAGALASRSSKLIAAIVPSIANLLYAETIRMFSNSCSEAGYQVLLGDSGYPEVLEEELVSAILTRRPDGILLTGVDHSPSCRNLLLSANIPIVETWDITPDPLDVVVGFNHQKVGQAVAAFINDKGYDNVGFVTADDTRGVLRRQSAQDALEDFGYRTFHNALVTAPTNMGLGRSGARQLLDSGFASGVIFCSSDTLAQGVVAELQSRSFRIPQDIAIIGFGDQIFSAHIHPPLTTVHIDRERIGKEAVDALLARLNNRPLASNIIDIGFTILEREST